MRSFFSLNLCVVLMLSACASHPKQDNSPALSTTSMTNPTETVQRIQAALPAYTWELIAATDKNGKAIASFTSSDNPSQPPINLVFSQSRVQVVNACNLISGEYVLAPMTNQSSGLKLGHLMSTKMACMGSLAVREQAMSAFLAGDLMAELQVDTMQLRLRGIDESVLEFKGVPTPETLYGSDSEQIFLEVAAQKKPCHGMVPMQCLQVRTVQYDSAGLQISTGEWGNFHDDIQGYTHQEGMRTVLRINRFNRKEPIPADASQYVYVLDMIVSQSTE